MNAPSRRAAALLSAAALSVAGSACAPTRPANPFPIIPAPAERVTGEGHLSLTASAGIGIGTGVRVGRPLDTALRSGGAGAPGGGPTPSRSARDGEARRVAELWASDVRSRLGWSLPVADSGTIRLILEEGHAAEGYRLRIDGNGVEVRASGGAGLYYGLRTLEQMLPPDRKAPPGVRVPFADLTDAPRFGYRGMHLDVGRHFFGVDAVKRYLDIMARYKLNRFHWHLTEDQGWRIQIDRYPRLTEVGAWRAETQVERSRDPYVGDGRRYGGFYTKEEVREIVAYAQERFITVIPEIEMPGHSLAALAAYPELACTPGPFEVGTRWGVEEDIYCPKEETFEFLENVLLEVMDLFPGEYIHIGGDEAPKKRWEESPVAQSVIEREGLADEHELQSWFIRRIEAFLNRHGRRLIGWDEILEGGLAPNATVMSWRGIQGGIEAARQGHDVIMTPTTHMYFDYYQGDPAQEPLAIGGYLPLERVYAFEPVPAELTPEEARHILGVQANLWTEYIPTEEYLQYMLLPRMIALAEVAWSRPEERSFSRFARNLPWHLRRLDALGINYRIPDIMGLERDRLVLGDDATVVLRALVEGQIRYTLDGSDPGPSSRLYEEPIEVDLDGGPVTVSARAVLADGRMGAVRRATFTRTEARAAAMVDPETLEPGLRLEYMEGRFRTVARMDRGEVTRREDAESVSLPEWVPDQDFGLRFRGYLEAPVTGVYTVRLTSDDGSVLRVGNQVVVDHDGPHVASLKEVDVALEAGLHPFEVLYFQLGGGKALSLEVVPPPGAPEVGMLRVRR